jgi:hypothetical protein
LSENSEKVNKFEEVREATREVLRREVKEMSRMIKSPEYSFRPLLMQLKLDSSMNQYLCFYKSMFMKEFAFKDQNKSSQEASTFKMANLAIIDHDLRVDIQGVRHRILKIVDYDRETKLRKVLVVAIEEGIPLHKWEAALGQNIKVF